MSTIEPLAGQTGGSEPQRQRNTILAHNEGTGEYMRPPTVSGVVNIGGLASIQLPDLAAQKAGFYLPEEHRNLLIQQYPRVYKALMSGAVAVPIRVPPRNEQDDEAGQSSGGAEETIIANAGGGQTPVEHPDEEGQS